MPIISGGGGAGGPAAGSYLPVANKTGVTVNTTTYDDVLAGSGKMTTLVFPAGVQGALAFAVAGDAFPRMVLASRSSEGLFFGDGTVEPTANGANIYASGAVGLTLNASNGPGTVGIFGDTQAPTPTTANAIPRLSNLSPRFTVTSGALSTVQLVTATGAQISTTRDAETVTPCTFNPGAATTATVTVALSPDNVTYSTVAVVTEPAGVALDGTILPVSVRVPAGWYLKLTVNAQATLGLTTWY